MGVAPDPVAESRQIAVHRATLADAPRLAELSGQLGYPTSPEEAEQRFRELEHDPQHALFIARLPDGRVIGWAHVHEVRLIEAETRAEISGLVVDEKFRRSGAGRLLMQQAERWARSRGYRAVVLRSNVTRTWAHVFYERLGYRVVKQQKVFRKDL